MRGFSGRVEPARVHLAVPNLAEAVEKGAAFVFEPEIFDVFVFQVEIPFVSVAMLENSPSAEIVLAHGVLNPVDGCWNQRIARSHFTEGEMKGFFITVNVLMIEIGVFVEPQGQG